jgi:hypothetical protein
MKAIIITLALLLAAPFVSAEPVPAPGVEIVAAGCSPCSSGDRATFVLEIVNPGPARGVQLVALLRHPAGAVYPLPAAGTVLLPPGPSSIVLADFTLPAGTPGVYLVEAALVDPQTGRDLARDVIGVARE